MKKDFIPVWSASVKLWQQNLDAFLFIEKQNKQTNKNKQRVTHTCPQLSFPFYVGQDSTTGNSVSVC